MRNIRRGALSLCFALTVVLATVTPTQAGAWHSGNIWGALLSVFCLDGVEVTLIEPHADFQGYKATFTAYNTPETYQEREPIAVPFGDEVQIQDAIGSTSLTTTLNRPYKFIEEPDFVYVTPVQYWNQGVLTWPELPQGTVLAVQITDEYGVVMDTWLGMTLNCRISD